MGADSCAIYGLESQGRALCSHTGDQESIRFYVGTLSPRTEGQLHQIDFDEETNQIGRKVYKTRVGEIWQVVCSPVNSQLIGLTYNNIKDTSATLESGIFHLPNPKSGENNEEVKCLWKFDKPDEPMKDEECRGLDWHPSKGGRIALTYQKGFTLWDNDGPSYKIHSTYKMNQERGVGVYMGKWNPHLDGNQYSLVLGSGLVGVDVRSMDKAWEFTKAHKFQIRDIDFNPNKQYYFATCGDDCTTKFWDIRNPKECLKQVCEHSHWVWRVRYNSFHDQLVLTSGSDSRVILQALPSISSEPKGHIVYEEEDEENPSSRSPPSKNKEGLEEGVLSKYEEHEDAVYVCEWSTYDPWIFASLSYDGRLVINRVPQSQKYKILL